MLKFRYDIKGQLLEVFDPYDRSIFQYTYDTSGKCLRTYHLDSGVKTAVMDALGNLVVGDDAKGARTLSAYDHLMRPIYMWARDTEPEAITLRQKLEYGDSSGLTDSENQNLKGQLYVHYDEAGRLTYTGYDFKGNLLNHYRQLINDTAVIAYEKYAVDWDNFNMADLSTYENTVTQFYDALNRVRKAWYPKDQSGGRKELLPAYNNAGALQSMQFDGTYYVKEIAYNAKGQRK